MGATQDKFLLRWQPSQLSALWILEDGTPFLNTCLPWLPWFPLLTEDCWALTIFSELPGKHSSLLGSDRPLSSNHLISQVHCALILLLVTGSFSLVSLMTSCPSPPGISSPHRGKRLCGSTQHPHMTADSKVELETLWTVTQEDRNVLNIPTCLNNIVRWYGFLWGRQNSQEAQGVYNPIAWLEQMETRSQEIKSLHSFLLATDPCPGCEHALIWLSHPSLLQSLSSFPFAQIVFSR